MAQPASEDATELDALRARVEVGVRELELSQLMMQLRRVGAARDSTT